MVWRTVAFTLFVVVATTAIVPGGAIATDDEAPLADAGLDQRVEQGTSVMLDGTGSRDPGGELDGYRWTIRTPDGDEIRPECPDCARTRFSAEETGRYEVTVVVKDTSGNTATDTLYVTVADGEDSTEEEAAPAPSAVPPTTSNPVGVDSETTDSTSDCTDGCSGSSDDEEPWVELNGPSEVAVDQAASFTIEYGGFDSEPTFGWSISGYGTSTTTSWNSQGKEVIYVTAATENVSLHTSHDVAVVSNQKPVVDIEAPDTFHPGDEITLTADVSDPDGRVVSTEWSDGPTITVPEEGNAKTITLSATDDSGGTSTDNINIKSEEMKSNAKQTSSAHHTVHCFYDDRSERMRQAPDHCEIENATSSGDTDGYQSLSGNLDRMLKSPNYNVVWKKTEHEVRQHSGSIPDDTGVTMPDTEDNDGITATIPTLDSSQLRAIRGGTTSTETDSFELNDKSVQNDVNGDGEVNAVDWDRRFGSEQKTTHEVHRGVIGQLRDAQRANRRAQRGGGPKPSETNTGLSLPGGFDTNSNSESRDSSDDTTLLESLGTTTESRATDVAHRAVDRGPGSTGATGGSSGDANDSGSSSDSDGGGTDLNGIDASLPDDLSTHRTSGSRAAEIGQKIANSDVV